MTLQLPHELWEHIVFHVEVEDVETLEKIRMLNRSINHIIKLFLERKFKVSWGGWTFKVLSNRMRHGPAVYSTSIRNNQEGSYQKRVDYYWDLRHGKYTKSYGYDDGRIEQFYVTYQFGMKQGESYYLFRLSDAPGPGGQGWYGITKAYYKNDKLIDSREYEWKPGDRFAMSHAYTLLGGKAYVSRSQIEDVSRSRSQIEDVSRSRSQIEDGNYRSHYIDDKDTSEDHVEYFIIFVPQKF
jgi:hypothetical protein